jgi:hypothetical protein
MECLQSVVVWSREGVIIPIYINLSYLIPLSLDNVYKALRVDLIQLFIFSFKRVYPTCSFHNFAVNTGNVYG